MRAPAPLAALVLAAILLAGCAAPPEPAATASGVDRAPLAALAAALADLPCEAPWSEGTTGNLRVLAQLPLDDPRPAYHRELDHDADRPLVASARIDQGGVDLVDVTDPAAPVVVSTWSAEDGDLSLDVKFSTDGATLVVAGDERIRLVDVRDPAAPRLASTYMLEESSAHMVTVFPVGGVDHVAASKGEGGDLSIFRMRGEQGERTLERIATPQLTPVSALPTRSDLVRSHDAWFEVDPVTGTPLLWVANVWFGVLALDVTDPAAPKTVASIPHEDAYQSYTHSVRVAHVDGKRLVVAASEYGLAAVKVWDATDLEKPKHLVSWSLRGDAPHDIQVVGSTLLVTHFEHGLYAMDLAGAPDGKLPLLAHLAPTGSWKGARLPGNLFTGYFGPVDVIAKDGLLYVNEETAGMSVVAFGCFAPGDAAATSRG